MVLRLWSGRLGEPKKPEVWLVEDVEAIREGFEKAHQQFFNVRLFQSPSEVLAALDHRRPRLCSATSISRMSATPQIPRHEWTLSRARSGS